MVSVMTAVSVVFPSHGIEAGTPQDSFLLSARVDNLASRRPLRGFPSYVDTAIPQGPGLVEYSLSTTPQRQRPMWGFLTLFNWDAKKCQFDVHV